MQELIELSSIITKKKLMKLSILGQSDSKLDHFYELLAGSQVKTDDEAAKQLYQKTGSHSPYQKLKSKLKNRMVDMLFLIDVNQPINNNAGRAYEEAWRLWAAANLMLLKDAMISGIDYAEKAMRLAIKYEHADLVVQIAKVLRKFYATRMGDEKSFNYYDQLYKNYTKLSQAEAQAEECYERIMMLAVKEKPTGQEISQLGENFYRQLEPLLDQHKTFTIHRFIRYIQVTYLLNACQFEETIEASQKALDFFYQKEFNLKSTIIGFLQHQLVCYTQLKQYEEGRKKLSECLELYDDYNGYGWFKIMELGLILYFHSKHYQEAYELIKEVLEHPKLRYQDMYTQESWKIYKSYVHYLVFIKKVTPAEDDKQFNNFRLGKFLNEVPLYSRDKRGMNIPILVIQILFTIAMKRYDQAFDRIEAIEKYTSRYIRKDDHFRSNCFIKMLLQIPVAGFHRRAVQRYAEKYQKKLFSQPLEIANQPHEIEIIPYEELWGMALQSLELKITSLTRV